MSYMNADFLKEQSEPRSDASPNSDNLSHSDTSPVILPDLDSMSTKTTKSVASSGSSSYTHFTSTTTKENN